jgi:hypothetical protein
VGRKLEGGDVDSPSDVVSVGEYWCGISGMKMIHIKMNYFNPLVPKQALGKSAMRVEGARRGGIDSPLVRLPWRGGGARSEEERPPDG